jgi:hypothetical protein
VQHTKQEYFDGSNNSSDEKYLCEDVGLIQCTKLYIHSINCVYSTLTKNLNYKLSDFFFIYIHMYSTWPC